MLLTVSSPGEEAADSRLGSGHETSLDPREGDRLHIVKVDGLSNFCGKTFPDSTIDDSLTNGVTACSTTKRTGAIASSSPLLLLGGTRGFH